MFLTPEQLLELTGYEQPAAQIRALDRMGIKHQVRPNGKPAVLSTHIVKLFGGEVSAARSTEPDWKALNA